MMPINWHCFQIPILFFIQTRGLIRIPSKFRFLNRGKVEFGLKIQNHPFIIILFCIFSVTNNSIRISRLEVALPQ